MKKIILAFSMFIFIPLSVHAYCQRPIGSCNYGEDFSACQNRINAENNAYYACQNAENLRKETNHYRQYGCPYPTTVCIK